MQYLFGEEESDEAVKAADEADDSVVNSL